MKWRINWWLHNGRLRRGHDIVETDLTFSKNGAERMFAKEAFNDKAPMLQNFGFWHTKSITELGFVSNFGVLSIKRVKEETEQP